MPTYKDKNNKWYCQFYYTDPDTGKRKKKLKRGFTRKKDAKQWEEDFLDSLPKHNSFLFRDLVAQYLEKQRDVWKPSTYYIFSGQIESKITSYFGDMDIHEITVDTVEEWHRYLRSQTTTHGAPLSSSSIALSHRQLSSIFNYGIKRGLLERNPAALAGNVKTKKRTVTFWTAAEFNRFITTFDPDDMLHTVYMTLFYTGMRLGELLALQIKDFDYQTRTIRITKTLHVINGEVVIQTPKTAAGDRVVIINQSLADEIRDYLSRLYDYKESDRLFYVSKKKVEQYMVTHAEMAGVKRIRVHDLRHSHASLLIEMGYQPILIAERLGHESPQMVLKVYGHLYPSKHSEVADRLETIWNSIESF